MWVFNTTIQTLQTSISKNKYYIKLANITQNYTIFKEIIKKKTQNSPQNVSIYLFIPAETNDFTSNDFQETVQFISVKIDYHELTTLPNL